MKKNCRAMSGALLIGALSLSLLTGCHLNISAKPSEDGKSVNIEVRDESSENDTVEPTENSSEEPILATETTEETTVEMEEPTQDVTDNTEDTTVTETPDMNTVVNADDYDYVSQTGMAFNCSKALTMLTDTESYASYECDEISMFEITLEDNQGYYTLDEEVQNAKDVYAVGDDVEVVGDKAATTTSGHNARVLICKDNGAQYYTCFIWIETGSSVKSLKSVFDTEDGYALFQEISDSLVYIYY